MKNVLSLLKKLLYPPHCAVCGEVLPVERWRVSLCASCEEHLPFCASDRCPHCGGKTNAPGFCDVCLKPFAFSAAFAAFPYAAVRKSIHLYKYRGGKELGDGLGSLMADYLLRFHAELPPKIDCIVSVPLHPKKQKRRGFNQTALLCQKIAERTALPFLEDGLYRKRHTVAQSLLSPQERKENLLDAFGTQTDFSGKRVLLVDDIITSGSTCNECAKALYRAGAQEVFVFCLSAAGSIPADGKVVYEDSLDPPDLPA